MSINIPPFVDRREWFLDHDEKICWHAVRRAALQYRKCNTTLQDVLPSPLWNGSLEL